MSDFIEMEFNPDTETWCVKEEPYATIECKTEEDFEMLQETLRFLNERRKGRYRWHDLRRDPEDFPEKHKNVLVAFNSQGGIGYAVSERLDDAQRWSALCGMAPFAWREIEPFEEVEAE